MKTGLTGRIMLNEWSQKNIKGFPGDSRELLITEEAKDGKYSGH